MICECCHDNEVDDPAVDWCMGCERHICDDCIACYDDDSGGRWCIECADAERIKGGKAGHDVED